jgi:hypothetical protein
LGRKVGVELGRSARVGGPRPRSSLLASGLFETVERIEGTEGALEAAPPEAADQGLEAGRRLHPSGVAPGDEQGDREDGEADARVGGEEGEAEGPVGVDAEHPPEEDDQERHPEEEGGGDRPEDGEAGFGLELTEPPLDFDDRGAVVEGVEGDQLPDGQGEIGRASCRERVS